MWQDVFEEVLARGGRASWPRPSPEVQVPEVQAQDGDSSCAPQTATPAVPWRHPPGARGSAATRSLAAAQHAGGAAPLPLPPLLPPALWGSRRLASLRLPAPPRCRGRTAASLSAAPPALPPLLHRHPPLSAGAAPTPAPQQEPGPAAPRCRRRPRTGSGGARAPAPCLLQHVGANVNCKRGASGSGGEAAGSHPQAGVNGAVP